MNQERNEIVPEMPSESQNSQSKETVSWLVNVILKIGAGYLAKVILDALGF